MKSQKRTLLVATVALALVLLVSMIAPGSFLQADAHSSGAAREGPSEPETNVDGVATSDPIPGALEVQAMRFAYPARITAADVRDGEWALEMDGRWYYWSDGRLLPAELRSRAESFVPIRFYRYELGPLVPREIDDTLSRVLEDRTSRQSGGGTDTRERFNDFLDTLYQIRSEADAERLVRRVEFLGSATRVHPLVVEPLARVERTIRALVPHHPEVARFVDGLAAVHGYNWRTIAGTVRRSYHSYGIAVDLVPRSYRGEWPYWLWAAQGGIDRWWELPVDERWQIPQLIVDAFEEEGFIWGGKWLFFDNLHFEYRPESIHMAMNRGE
ncbi:MAG: M15 family metallopeptidase [Spirochaetota bacterium]